MSKTPVSKKPNSKIYMFSPEDKEDRVYWMASPPPLNLFKAKSASTISKSNASKELRDSKIDKFALTQKQLNFDNDSPSKVVNGPISRKNHSFLTHSPSMHRALKRSKSLGNACSATLESTSTTEAAISTEKGISSMNFFRKRRKQLLGNPHSHNEKQAYQELLDHVQKVFLAPQNTDNTKKNLVASIPNSPCRCSSPIEEVMELKQHLKKEILNNSNINILSLPKPHIENGNMKDVNSNKENVDPVSNEKSPKELCYSSDSDQFDDIFGDYDEAMIAATQAIEKELVIKKASKDSTKSFKVENVDFIQQQDVAPTHIQQNHEKKYRRLMILEISLHYFQDTDGIRKPEKVLRGIEVATGKDSCLLLREDWITTEVDIGHIINYVGDLWNSETLTFVVDNKSGLLILHPDLLISSTVVAESFSCTRKAVLDERVRRGIGVIDKAVLYGIMVHELFQNSLQKKDFSTRSLQSEVQKLISDNLENIYCANETEESAKVAIQEYISSLQSWAKKHFCNLPSSSNILANNSKASLRDELQFMVQHVMEIEEGIWSPMYGLRGKVDVTLQAKFLGNPEEQKNLTLPLELKSGKSSSILSHRAQTILYTLLMSDRYSTNINLGLLFYPKSEDTVLVSASRDEVRGIMMGRNTVSTYLVNKERLPAMIRNKFKCERCYSQDTCFIYHKLLEDGTSESSNLGNLFDENTEHLTPKHKEFLQKWDRLITMEEKDLMRFRKEIWTVTSEEREKSGKCLKNMIVYKNENTNKLEGGRYICRFIRSTESPKESSLLNSYINVGDAVVLSSEQYHYALAIGFVSKMYSNFLELSLDRPVCGIPVKAPNFDAEKNQMFMSTNDFLESKEHQAVTYRIDKDEMSTGLGLLRANVLSMFQKGMNSRLRQLLVDLEPPQFRKSDTHATYSLESLNIDQKQAVRKIVSAKDYALVLGMPGTGKTTTIVHIIKALVAQQKRILLTSYTHTAVDNVILKLGNDINVVRLGSLEKIHPGVLPLSSRQQTSAMTSVMQLENFYMKQNVFATTCLGITNPVLSKMEFDYCIVDEASQLTFPVCIGPISLAKVFILVGDHYQLPPLVRNADALKKGLSNSLFKLLSEAHPDAVVTLRHQYRMNQDIMEVANRLIYSEKLRCGTPDIAESQLALPKWNQLNEFHEKKPSGFIGTTRYCLNDSTCWLKRILDPELKVIFVNTDSIGYQEQRIGDIIQNEVEAQLISQSIHAMISCGVEPNDIGVISPYRSQVRLLTHFLSGEEAVEIYTVDKYQGRDKECIFVSLVRSNSQKNVGDLLRDWRRVNVAVTRAKKKLIIFGSKSTLEGSELFLDLISLCEEKGWMLQLPSHAHELHYIEMPKDLTLSQREREKTDKKAKVHILPGILKKNAMLNNILQEQLN